METQIILAGFGGQGILFAGKVLAYCALEDGKQLTWLPSYGPEMRGGTANCSVCISEDQIGSPVIQSPDILIVMNEPSIKKFEDRVRSDGIILADSSIIKCGVQRSDVKFVPVAATDYADRNGLQDGANMILLGKLLALTDLFSMKTVKAALEKCVSPKRAHLIPHNIRAVEAGKTLSH